ncbi:MAG TPA: hypothetical protein VIK77_05860 [Tissierellaceae bacterium]
MKNVKDEKIKIDELLEENISEQLENGSSDLVSLIAISELTNLNKLKVITRLKDEQIPLLTKLYMFAETFNVPFVKNMADNILQLQISIRGLGRKELVNIVRESSPPEVKRGIFGTKDVFR